MGLSEEVDQDVLRRFADLCRDLNMDKNTADQAWHSYDNIKHNYTLEGNQLHWLGCALYVACRKATIPTVARPGAVVEGNCVSLVRLLRSCRMSLIQFFDKSKKWADMANLSQEFRSKIERLERNFAVSTVIFKKFQPIFLDMFRDPADNPPRLPRNRKYRKLPPTSSEIFDFCWTLFACVKGNFQQISDDLVNSYHLLLACCDMIFGNVLMSNRKELLNMSFAGLPAGLEEKSWSPPSEPPCVIHKLCERHDGIHVEAAHIKEYWWKPHLKKMFESKVLRGDSSKQTGMLDPGNFEYNVKQVDKQYEEFVLNFGDFDERIYLGEDAHEEIGTPTKISSSQGLKDFTEKMQAYRSQQQQHHSDVRGGKGGKPDSFKVLIPNTPLTGRMYLEARECHSITPVSTATQSVSRLQALLAGRKASPSDALMQIFCTCLRNPEESIQTRIREMGEVFCTRYAQRSDDCPGSHIDFAKKRLQLGETLYYKLLENILTEETKRKKTDFDLTFLIEQDIFHQSLFACCLEIVIFSYNSQRAFPWVLDVFGLEPFHFYKVIEVTIRAEDQLSRDVVKHLNHIEEQILEHMAWRSESPLWDLLKRCPPVPLWEEVSLPSQLEADKLKGKLDGQSVQLVSSLPNPTVQRLVTRDRQFIVRHPGQSPVSSISERFQSPVTHSAARKRLFVDPNPAASSSIGTPVAAPMAAITLGTPLKPGQSLLQTSAKGVLNIKTISGENGEQYIPIPYGKSMIIHSGTPGTVLATVTIPSSVASQLSTPKIEPGKEKPKPKRSGSIGLFFRKFYYLASVRLQELCTQLKVSDTDLRRKIWTCFEHSIVNHTDLMQDRHLDQILMCAVYVVCRVTDKEQPFMEIMRCYRMQPQAASHVYRSVLLCTKRRRGSGSSSNGTSSASSPTPSEDAPDDKKGGNEGGRTMRSSSTLPPSVGGSLPHHPHSAPPTPTKLAGTATSFEYEDRGDLIKFYNSVYVVAIQKFALKFSKKNENLSLSPLPQLKAQPMSPCRKVSDRHQVYTRSLTGSLPASPSKPLQYHFNRSPAKDLRMINTMLQDGASRRVGKRLLQTDEAEMSGGEDGRSEGPMAKKPAPVLCSKIQNVVGERQASQSHQQAA